MSTTLQARIEDYLGASFADTAALTDWLTAGVRVVTDRLPIEEVEKFTVDIADAGSGISIIEYRLLRAHKLGNGAQMIDAGQKTRALSAASIHYASSNYPVCYIENGLLFIKPGGGTGIGMLYPVVTFETTDILAFPPKYDDAVVIYATIRAAINKLMTALAALNALSFSASTPPTAPTAATFTYTDATGATVATVTLGALGTPPTYTKPTFAGAFTQANTYIVTDEDIELAQVELSRQKELLDQFQIDIQNELNEFNKDVIIYTEENKKVFEQGNIDIQKAITDAKISTDVSIQNKAKDLEEQVQQYSANMNRFIGQVQLYGQQINEQVAKYSGDIQKVISQFGVYTEMIKVLRSEFESYFQ